MNTAVFHIRHYEIEVHGFPQRQAETLARTAVGQSSKETAKAMGISPRTVEMNLNLAMARFGALNRVHLATEVVTAGLVVVRKCAGVLVLIVTLVAGATPTATNNPDDFNRLSARSVRIRRRNEDKLTTIINLTEDDDA